MRRKKRKKWKSIKICFILLYSFFLFLFFFCFSNLTRNNLNGTIPTQIGLMTSLQILWEWKKRKKWKSIKICLFFYLFFSFCFSFVFFFPFILVVSLSTIWMEQFQLKLAWWLHYIICEKKKKERNEIKICFFLIFFSFCFSFHFSDLSFNNLNGTIPTQIGLMTLFSLQFLWEEKKRNEIFIKFVLVYFFLEITVLHIFVF